VRAEALFARFTPDTLWDLIVPGVGGAVLWTHAEDILRAPAA
jgi:hypothetical protein